MTPVERTDEELMRLFQDGDAAAFEVLYLKYKRPIFGFLARQCGDPETAADLAHDVFNRVIRGARGFHHQSRFSTWIYTIARNLAVDHARKARHRRHLSLDQGAREDLPPLGERIAADAPAPDRSATAGRLQQDLARVIDILPEEQREVFLLREYHGMPFQEIAEAVGAKVGTVKSRMRYALATLRKELAQYEAYARSLS